MKKNSKKPDQDQVHDNEAFESYYDLKTDAVEALVNADTDEVPQYSREELEKYRTKSPIRVPEVLKVCFIKWWFAGAMYYFCGFGLTLSHWLDMWIVYSIVLGMVTDILTNNILTYFEKEPGSGAKWLMVPKKGMLSFFLNILYSFPVILVVWFFYQVIFGTDRAEPLSFGLFVLIADLAFVGLKNLIVRFIKKKRG